MAQAFEDKKQHPEKSWRQLSTSWGVSDKTIARYCSGDPEPQRSRFNEDRLALRSDHLEQRIVHFVLYFCDAGIPLRSHEVIKLAERVAKDAGVIAADAVLSKKWLVGFKKRRPVITSRLAETLSSLRNTASSAESQLRHVFANFRFGELLDRLYQLYNIRSDVQIGSFDEVHLDTSGTLGKRDYVLARKGSKHVRLPSGPTEGTGQACSVVAGGTGRFSFSILILVKVLSRTL